MSGFKRGAQAAYKIYVGNLPWTVSKRELQNYLSKFGPIRDCKVLFNKETGLSRGYGFVMFRNAQGVEAVTSQNVHILEGNRLNITGDRIKGMSKEAIKQAETETEALS